MSGLYEEKNLRFINIAFILIDEAQSKLLELFKCLWDNRYPKCRWKDNSQDLQILIDQCREEFHFYDLLRERMGVESEAEPPIYDLLTKAMETDSKMWDTSTLVCILLYSPVPFLINRKARKYLQNLRMMHRRLFKSTKMEMSSEDYEDNVGHLKKIFAYFEWSNEGIINRESQVSYLKSKLGETNDIRLDDEKVKVKHMENIIERLEKCLTLQGKT